jgi:hypothetical protein
MIEQNLFCEDRAKNKNIQFFPEKLNLLWLCWDLQKGSTKLIPEHALTPSPLYFVKRG